MENAVPLVLMLLYPLLLLLDGHSTYFKPIHISAGGQR